MKKEKVGIHLLLGHTQPGISLRHLSNPGLRIRLNLTVPLTGTRTFGMVLSSDGLNCLRTSISLLSNLE